MTNQRSKRLPKILLGQLLVAFIIIAIALSLIFYSQGWRVNFNTFKIYKTGLLLFDSSPAPDQIYIGNNDFKGKKGFTKNLLPGSYKIKANKSGYIEWSREIIIKPEMVSYFNNVILIKQNIISEELTDQSKIDFLNSPDTILVENAKDRLAFNKYEIWTENRLITRFSEAISNVKWYPDMLHIVYQKGDEIRIIDNDGFNDSLLVKLSSKEQTRFQIGGRGQEIYYFDSGAYKKAVIK